MRTTFRTLSAAFLAALFALASCDKSDIAVGGGIQQQTGGSRVIAVSFQNNTTKTELDGFQPKFKDGDEIKVANGTGAPEVCTVSVDGDEATITTSLSGPLTMVYPATAAKMNGNAIDGILVPTEQDGTFASANISMAENIAEGATSATFENQTVLFKVTPPDGVKQFTITSLKPVVDGVARTGTAVAINTEGADDAAKLVVSVGGASSDLTTFYVSLAAGVNLTDLKFEYQTTGVAGMDGAIKGITEKSLTASSVSNVTAANTLYTIDANNWHPYVEIAGKKWATMNVGATTVAGDAATCYGEYFAYGETTGHKLNVGMTAPADEHDFSFSTEPFSNGIPNYNYAYFLANKSTWLTDADVLKPAYDAATANWGSSWRMPTHEEFQALYSACTDKSEGVGPESLPETITDGGVYWSADYNGVAGILFVDKLDISKRVFFPAAGNVRGTSFGDGGTGGYYRSSSHTASPLLAYNLYFEVWAVNPSNCIERYSGFTVRPFSE